MRILISGIAGRMGRAILENVKNSGAEAVGLDKFPPAENFGVSVYTDINSVKEKIDCIVDFSVREAVYDFLPYAVKNSIPCVIGTTGHDAKQLSAIENAAKKIPIFKSGNMSVGINLLIKLAKIGAKSLGDSADVEIIEQHHNQKTDAPSGTALMIADAIKKELNGGEIVCGRKGYTGKRTKSEIGIHSVRGGTVTGKHEILFLSDHETITLAHEAESKTIFAAGGVRAARYIIGKPPGLYDMEDLLN